MVVAGMRVVDINVIVVDINAIIVGINAFNDIIATIIVIFVVVRIIARITNLTVTPNKLKPFLKQDNPYNKQNTYTFHSTKIHLLIKHIITYNNKHFIHNIIYLQ
eukprot:GHVR01037734.1.p1 GENE.GHVR01037734.1~~GHVR01037734.1.p1  ORF type:complete len:105 (-),score=10.95 GHVR01037734.1:3077-3391(-)